MRRNLTILLSLIIAVMFALPVSAERTLPLLIDDANLLTANEYDTLLEILEDVSTRGQCEVAVVTVNSLGSKSAMAYADDFFDDNGYGYGDNDDGVLLLISMGEREWHITTHGYGTIALTDYALYLTEEAFLDDLSGGNYFDAFETFAGHCDNYITLAREGTPVDYDGDPNDSYYYDDYYAEESFDPLSLILPSLFIGLVIAFFTVNGMKKNMTTVKMQTGAANYVKDGSLSLTSQSDRFLYSNVTRVRRNTDSGGSRSSGGSRTHRSSSGRSHGGRGGRF